MVQTYKKMKTKMNRAQNAAQRKTFFTFEAKKLLELSSAKLTALSIGLLLAVFCTIGMSFTPATEDNVVDPNDSTYIAGPRRSHYFKSGTCSDTNHYVKDYAKATASTAGNGYVTLSSPSGGGLVTNPASYANGTTLTSGSNSGASVSISWNCNHKETEDGKVTATAAMHTRKFTIKAFPNENYYFKGWSTSTSENDIFGNANPYTFDQTIDDWNQNNGSHEAENKALTTTYYAIFKPEVIANLTFAVPEHGSYTFSTEDVFATTVSSSTGEKQLTTKKAVTLTATPASGYKFFGWYKNSDSPANYLGYTSPLTLGFEEDATIYAKFIKSDAALFQVKGETSVTYYDLNVACTAASSSSSKVVVPIINGSVYEGNYTIPNGVTFLIPYDAAYTVTTAPTEVTTWASLSEFRRLKLASGVNITVNGAICIAGRQFGTSSSNPGPGSILGAYGVLDMSTGGSIVVSNGAKLYAYGFVIGSGNQSASGTITIKSGGTVYENLVINDMHGGGGSAACVNGMEANNDYGLFPFNQYFIQNIEPKMIIEYGGVEKGYYDISASLGGKHDAANVIGNSSQYLFEIKSGGSFTKWYDANRDYQCYEVKGGMSMNSMSVYATSSIGLVSSKFVLPIGNNMDITIANGAILTLPYRVKFLPGAILNIEEGATVNVQNEFYFYDYQDWDMYACGYAQTFGLATNGKKLSWHTLRDVSASNKLGHAKLVINGTLNLSSSAALYTTSHGGMITSTGTGKIVFSVAGKTSAPNLYECWSTYGKGSDGTALEKGGKTKSNVGPASDQVLVGKYSGYNIYGTPIPCTPAQLHNSDAFKNTYGAAFEYLATSGAAANTTITYANGHWGWVGKWKDANGAVISAATVNTCTEGDLASKAPAAPAKSSTVSTVYTFKEWVAENRNEANQEVIYKPTYTESPRPYTITWVDGDGNTLKTEQIKYGSTPSYSGDTPQKSSTVDKVFTFKNTWSPSITTVSDDAIYTAQFDESTREYTVTWKDMDATFTQEQQIVKTEQVKYGARPNYFNYPKPDRNGMTFDVFGWSNGEMQYKKVGDVLPELPVVTGYVTYTALYNALVEHKQVSEPESLDVDINAATTTIHTGGRLTIPESKKLTTTDFVLEATADASGELIGNVAAENIYFDLIIGDTESRHWHAFTVPFVVDLTKAGKPIQINGETLTLGRGYDIVYYNGAERAVSGKSAKCWKYVEDGDSILHPGKAYMIASASRAIDVVRFTKYGDEETRISISKNASSTGVDNDGGWNGIGNPKMYHAVLETGATVCQVHDGGRIGADGYDMYDLKERKLVVGKAVYVQVKADKDEVSVVAATNQEIIQPSSAPRKNKADRMSGRYDVHIAPADGEMADHIYLLADEEKEDRYVILADLAKAGVSPVRAQMWVDRYDDRLCMNTAVLVNNQADYPLGISVPNAGEYDIYIAAQPEEDAVMYLTLDGKPVWNLSYGGYTATLEKGTTNRYGLRLVKKSSKVPTGMEELTIENGGAVRKVLVNDKVYIIRNGETYTITGQMVK